MEDNADIPYQTRHPILLPRDHYLTTLIVRRAHQRVLHNGVKDTLSEVRSRYWIVKGRAFVKKTIHHCIVCRKLEGKPFLGPSPPPLPSFRLTEDPPFTYTGVDFAGPLHIKKLHGAGGHKVWICMLCCPCSSSRYCAEYDNHDIYSQSQMLLLSTRPAKTFCVRQWPNLQGCSKGSTHYCSLL